MESKSIEMITIYEICIKRVPFKSLNVGNRLKERIKNKINDIANGTSLIAKKKYIANQTFWYEYERNEINHDLPSKLLYCIKVSKIILEYFVVLYFVSLFVCTVTYIDSVLIVCFATHLIYIELRKQTYMSNREYLLILKQFQCWKHGHNFVKKNTTKKWNTK